MLVKINEILKEPCTKENEKDLVQVERWWVHRAECMFKFMNEKKLVHEFNLYRGKNTEENFEKEDQVSSTEDQRDIIGEKAIVLYAVLCVMNYTLGLEDGDFLEVANQP